MAPVKLVPRVNTGPPLRASLDLDAAILEAWAEGYSVGSLIILLLLVVCNYRRGVLLHKLIVVEIALALWHGTFIFLSDPAYDWYLSSTALLLYISYQVHNYVAYLKIRLFLPKWGKWTFLITLALVQPYWVAEIYANFAYFNGINNIWAWTRPWESLAREPWWIFTTCMLLYQIKSKYDLNFMALMKLSPRFGIMIFCMLVSLAFIVVDVIVTVKGLASAEGINPFWRLNLVFKSAADTIFLDDFKSVIERIISRRTDTILSPVTAAGSDPKDADTFRTPDFALQSAPAGRVERAEMGSMDARFE